eukprot:CAMPEP_0174321700 /NCGR_PEP_ID=MMETSP0810-20121108/10498_1 /TAXON_ID=73025 ORGANISM="Eutreptiella gymnastica-like, Strain CCMP1594" /NCGR_SAMPLE_ID=MMETSP0810 /ASSEMBLY_ACC=CAM_ASM_000659 /LENGTH=217 /DNA_ID=CAMNT_0015433247 /DNA_START=470 /DNA_END=1124 /DNA_ORIENTATION=+
MAFWASAAWGREALGVGVETSKRLDLSVKAQLVGVYMNASAVERSNASWMAGLGCILCGAPSHNSALPPVVCVRKWGTAAVCGPHRAVVAGGEGRAPLRDAPKSMLRVCVNTVAFAGALATFACAAGGACLRVPVYGRCGKRPSPMMGKKSAPKLEPVAPPLAVSCAPDAGARPVCKFPCSLCVSISAAVLRGRYVYGRNACVRCVPALATHCSSQY